MKLKLQEPKWYFESDDINEIIACGGDYVIPH